MLDQNHRSLVVIYFVVLTIFFFNDTATTEIYTLSLHDALPISGPSMPMRSISGATSSRGSVRSRKDRKSTRLNSSHRTMSYAVFCLKKKYRHRNIHVVLDTDGHPFTDTCICHAL